MPVDPEPAAATGRPRSVVRSGTDLVGFLDLPTVGVDGIDQAVREAFATLAPGAVLAVYSDRLGIAQAASLCRRCSVELLGSIAHPRGGITFTFRSTPTDLPDARTPGEG